ncbi:MAG: CDP-diacylglycerol--glycerol-3-phosphate 3-phosphatidyltransferase [Cyanobacteria bacterium P01_D01_bin.105]
MNLPTWITISRLLGVPIVLIALLDPIDTHRWFSVVVFLLFAGTDWLDGYLARKLNQVSDLGKFLDPLVDKLLVLAPLTALVELGDIPAWGVFLILARELTISGWRVNPVFQQGKVPGAGIWGKVKTVVQIVAIAILLAPLSGFWHTSGVFLFWVAVVLTWFSGLLYLLPAKTDVSHSA